MTTKQLLNLIKSDNLSLSKVCESHFLTILAKFTQSRQRLLDTYGVRRDMFHNSDFRTRSKDSNIYEGLDDVVNKMNNSDSEKIVFIEVKTENGDEISLFFQENDKILLGYIYIT